MSAGKEILRPKLRPLLRASRFRIVGGKDINAEAYVSIITEAGATVTKAQKAALSEFCQDGKQAGWWSKLSRLHLTFWGSAAANAACIRSGNSGSWFGTVTHSAGYVQSAAANGYLIFDRSPFDMGMRRATGLLVAGIVEAPSGTGFASHIGAAEVNKSVQLYSNLGTLNTTIVPTSTATWTTDRSNHAGVIIASRTGLNELALYRRAAAGFSTVATNTSTPGDYEPTDSILQGMAQTDAIISNGRYFCFGAGVGINEAHASGLSSALKTLWETCTGLTLP